MSFLTSHVSESCSRWGDTHKLRGKQKRSETGEGEGSEGKEGRTLYKQ